MKSFILGFISALIIGVWVTLAIIGIITVKVAIIVPVCLIIGVIIGSCILADLLAP